MNKHRWILLGALVVGALILWWPQGDTSLGKDYKNATYRVEGRAVALVGGESSTPLAPKSASRVTTRVFGDELVTDLDGDGQDDIAFILTQESGGSGTFYYVVGAVKRPGGYQGTDSYPLGDRVAPQALYKSPNPRHERVVVATYATRAAGEPFTAPATVGKSVYLKLDPATLQWGIVVNDFEGESR